MADEVGNPREEHRGDRRLYGRRLGRPLRAGQRDLRDVQLPRYSFDLPDQGPLDPRALFERPHCAIWLEIGFGSGEHLAVQAENHRDIGFIGCEVFANGIVKLVASIKRSRLDNVRLFTDDARSLLDALPAGSIDRIFILFPDPWPKQRHHKRRLISQETLDRLAVVMSDGAELRIATDDSRYLCWILERATAHPTFEWLARAPADWRQRPTDWPATRYEEKALAAGRRPTFLRLRRLAAHNMRPG